MGWTKDTFSEAPKIIYTYDGQGTASAGLRKLIYDPNASIKWTAELVFIAKPDEIVTEIEAGLGIA